ncbi:MAG: recombinase family protein [Clostridia bacterium]|nr:recombinase family protein [Clostridia bacterium]
MQTPVAEQPKKTVRIIAPTITPQETAKNKYRQLRVVAYCRVSTKQEEQLNSYETQKNYYTERINAEPNWTLVGIFADKGITGTSVKNRDEFNKMIKLCKRGKVDMIITKSISRFARNTLDCLKYTRMLKAIGVDVFFEEQGIHSTQPGAEFYITIYGSIAQSESENISANVKFGKAQSAREGNVAFHYKNFLGYRKGEDGKPEIVPEEAETVRFIYESFLAGDSIGGIKAKLEERGILSPSGKPTWNHSTIVSILTNEKYTGDAIINKTFIEDCISKKVKVNNGERQKFYVENNHPAIIDRMTFARVQEELARRNGKLKVKQVGTKTEQGKYSSKFALTELLVCGECKTPYRRCTWTVKGKKKIVWRCISRLDYGKKYCHESPTVEESVLQEAIMNAIMRTANENAELLKTLKLHIGMGLDMGESEDESLDLQIKIAEIDAEFKAMLNAVSSDTVDTFDEQRVKELMDEKSKLQQQLAQIAERKQKRENTKSRLDEIFTILDGIKNRPMEYDDRLVRRILECVVVESKERIKVVFIGGLEITETLCEKKTQAATEQQDETHSSSNPYKNDEKYLFCRPYTNKRVALTRGATLLFNTNETEGFERSVKRLFRGMSRSGDRRILRNINKQLALIVSQNSRTNPSSCAKRNVKRTPTFCVLFYFHHLFNCY